jgi:hypothetical protein
MVGESELGPRVLDPIMRRIALAKQNSKDFKAALGGMLDTPLWEGYSCNTQ